jgi:hypothetical protein
LYRLHALIAEHGREQWADLPAEEAAGRVVIGIETDRGPPRHANRRNVDARTGQLQAVLRPPALRQPAAVQNAYAAIVVGQVRLIATPRR